MQGQGGGEHVAPQLLHLLALLQQLLAAQVRFPGDEGFVLVERGERKRASSAKRGKTELREAGCLFV